MARTPAAWATMASRSSGLSVLTLSTRTDTPSLASASAASSALDTITPLANTAASVPSRSFQTLPIW